LRQIIVDFGTLHLLGHPVALRIYGYGLMLVLGFVLGILLAQWRARRAGESPEFLTHCGVLSLIGGILGSRIAYVIEQWDTQFAHQSLWEVFNVTSGGLIYYGGVIMATAIVLAYLRIKRLPVRRYLDILAPSLMVGLAFGRAGCLLNGCCYGGPCSAETPLAQRFPMFSKPLVNFANGAGDFSVSTDGPSPPYAEQYYNPSPRVDPDPRLVNTFVSRPIGPARSGPRRNLLHLPRDLHGRLENDQLSVMFGPSAKARSMFRSVAGADGQLDEAEWRQAQAGGDGVLRGSEHWGEAISFDRDGNGKLNFAELWDYLQLRRGAITERFDADEDAALGPAERRQANEYLQADLFQLAASETSAPVRPAQLLGLINALLLAALLTWFYCFRKREGQVFCLLIILYPITRFMLEAIRADNEHDVLRGVLTHNQYTSMALAAVGIVSWVLLRRLAPSAGPTWAQRQSASAPATHYNNRTYKR